jgi:tagatose-6-phosphate ketose/aldose isomerase
MEMAGTGSNGTALGNTTHSEIFQQPGMWLDTLRRLAASPLQVGFPALITGAGTSYYAALAIEGAWPGARAVASTDLILDLRRYVPEIRTVVSVARSGDSPESAGVVQSIQQAYPETRHIAITCNAEGKLARLSGVQTLLLNPRTNDRSLVMTSSFSNLTLAGILLGRGGRWIEELPPVIAACEEALPAIEELAGRVADLGKTRVAFLASPSLSGAAREASLKVLEMTAGRVIPLTETYLGLRHGPMSFLKPEMPVVCFLSSDPSVQRYELDLIAELRAKGLGFLVGIAPRGVPEDPFDLVISTPAQDLPDWLRTPFDIVFAQLLGLHLSLRSGLDPDNPSPGSVITRVVQGVTIYGR